MEEARPLRRKDRALPQAETEYLLQQGEWGVLATADGSGLPLATPLSYIWMDGAVYFHCAMAGHKLDNIASRPEVSFCVVGQTQPVYEGKSFSTFYESAIVHGCAVVVQDAAEKQRVLLALCEKYLPDYRDEASASVAKEGPHTAVVRIDVHQLAGKAKRKSGHPQGD